MGMRYADFWYNYTLREFWNAVEGFFEGEERRMKEDWERTRIVVGYLANQHAKHPKPFNKVLPFPWDNEKANVTESDLEFLRQDMKKRNNGS